LNPTQLLLLVFVVETCINAYIATDHLPKKFNYYIAIIVTFASHHLITSIPITHWIWISSQAKPISVEYRKSHVHFFGSRVSGKVASRHPHSDLILQRIFKICKGKKFPTHFFIFFYLITIYKPKSDEQVGLLRSRRSFRHKGWPNWLMYRPLWLTSYDI
jgi:hypothetical protein